MMKLTERAIASLTCPPGKRDRMVFDAECPGLGVRITDKGTRTFIMQRTDPAGRKVRIAVGVWGGMTLDQARSAVRAQAGRMAAGTDLKAERAQARAEAMAAKAEATLTLDKLIGDWGDLHLASRRPRYRAEAERALRVGFAAHLKKPAASLTKQAVVGILDDMLRAGSSAMAGRTVAYGRACYSWATKRGKLEGNPFLGLPVATATTPRERVLTDREIGAIWNAALGMAEPWGPLIRVLLLTLVRREEAAGMRWFELAADGATWEIPTARMKAARPHLVHLTGPTLEALGSVTKIEDQDLVFTTTGKTPVSGFSKIKITLDKASGVTGWRLHDFRRTGVSVLAGLGFNPVVADKLLAHQPHALSAVARVYQRNDFLTERKAALEAWAAHVLRCAAGRDAVAADNVLPLRRA
jgi:integrase